MDSDGKAGPQRMEYQTAKSNYPMLIPKPSRAPTAPICYHPQCDSNLTCQTPDTWVHLRLQTISMKPGRELCGCTCVLVPFLHPLLHESLHHKSRSGSLLLTVGPTASAQCLLKTQNLSHLHAHSSLTGSAVHPTSSPSRPSLPPLQLR